MMTAVDTCLLYSWNKQFAQEVLDKSPLDLRNRRAHHDPIEVTMMLLSTMSQKVKEPSNPSIHHTERIASPPPSKRKARQTTLKKQQNTAQHSTAQHNTTQS
jgi:hypothetical protein